MITEEGSKIQTTPTSIEVIPRAAALIESSLYEMEFLWNSLPILPALLLLMNLN